MEDVARAKGPRGRRRALARWLWPLAWAAGLLILSGQPADRLPAAGFRGSDKLVHALLYAALGALTGRALLGATGLPAGPPRGPPGPPGGGASGLPAGPPPGPSGVPRPLILLAAAALAGFGILDEWTQSFTPGRMSSAADVAADALGACAGLLVASRYYSQRHATHPQLRR